MVRVGVIGYGYWGPNLVRNLAEVPDVTLVKVADFKQERLDLARRRFPHLQTTTSPAEVIEDPGIDAVVIATPQATHFDLSMAALRANKHVLVEKPMCSSSDEAERMIEAAGARNLVLMVDHTFCYSGAVQKIRELIDSGEIGDIYYYDAARINLGLFREDASVLWDLAIHDLSIMDYAIRRYPTAVSLHGIEPRAESAGKRGVHDALLRREFHRPPARELVVAGETAAYADRRRPQNDCL